MSMPDGVVIAPLDPKPDRRGVFTDMFRAQWPTGCAPVQWNVVSSRPNVLRGFHVGVAHGFYFAKPSMHLYAVSHYWNMADDLGCRWNDPDIGLDWHATAPELSERDVKADTCNEMVESFDEGRELLRAKAQA